MKIQVLGTGCARCDELYRNTVEAAKRLQDAGIQVDKVGDPEVFLRLNVFVTPALVVDNRVVSTGKVLTTDQIEAELLKHRAGE